MSERAYHHQLRLRDFTAFEDATLEFVSGVNAFVGENGTGKTHVLKALYAVQLARSREDYSLQDILAETFQVKDPGDLRRLTSPGQRAATLSGRYGTEQWEFRYDPVVMTDPPGESWGQVERPVYIPAIDMMGHTRGFTEAYDEVRLDFDRTYRDIVSLLRLERRNGSHEAGLRAELLDVLGGELERDPSGRFYLVTGSGRLPMPLVAEGIRKVATLIQLQKNGWLVPGTTLLWDEPEVNLNPLLMDEVIRALLVLARLGVQVILATHSYVILKELDLQADSSASIRYFGFARGENGTTIAPADDLSALRPNPILDQYDSLYDRELTRSTRRPRADVRPR